MICRSFWNDIKNAGPLELHTICYKALIHKYGSIEVAAKNVPFSYDTIEAWKKKKTDVTFEKKIENAVRKSLEKAKKDDVILAFGSLSFLGEIVKALDTIRSEV